MAYSVEEEEQRRAQQGLGGAQPVTGGGGGGGAALSSTAAPGGSQTGQNRLGAYLNASNLAAGAGMGNTLSQGIAGRAGQLDQKIGSATAALNPGLYAAQHDLAAKHSSAPTTSADASNMALGAVYKGPADASSIRNLAGDAYSVGQSADRLGSFSGRGTELKSAGMGGGTAGGKRLNSWLTGAGGASTLAATKSAYGGNQMADRVGAAAGDGERQIGNLRQGYGDYQTYLRDAGGMLKGKEDEAARIAAERAAAEAAAPKKRNGVAGWLDRAAHQVRTEWDGIGSNFAKGDILGGLGNLGALAYTAFPVGWADYAIKDARTQGNGNATLRFWEQNPIIDSYTK